MWRSKLWVTATINASAAGPLQVCFVGQPIDAVVVPGDRASALLRCPGAIARPMSTGRMGHPVLFRYERVWRMRSGMDVAEGAARVRTGHPSWQGGHPPHRARA